MKPKDVNPDNFTVHHIVYNDGDFAIGYGKWDDEKMVLGMRWNGKDGKKGYPNDRWFRVSTKLTDIFLQSLLSSPYSNKKNIIKIYKS
jgi:hypothetical protein